MKEVLVLEWMISIVFQKPDSPRKIFQIHKDRRSRDFFFLPPNKIVSSIPILFLFELGPRNAGAQVVGGGVHGHRCLTCFQIAPLLQAATSRWHVYN